MRAEAAKGKTADRARLPPDPKSGAIGRHMRRSTQGNVMRRFVFAVALAVAFAGSAAAQPSTPYQSGLTNAATAIGVLPPDSREWVLAETARQAQGPTSLAEIDKALEEAIGADLPAGAKSLRATRRDLTAALRYEIVREARRMIDRELRDRRKDAKADQSDDMMLGLQALEGRRIRLGAMESQASRRLTEKSREIIAE